MTNKKEVDHYERGKMAKIHQGGRDQGGQDNRTNGHRDDRVGGGPGGGQLADCSVGVGPGRRSVNSDVNRHGVAGG